MELFIGREKELERLENLYSGGKFETCAIYGRRQIGKTALMRRFSVGKRTIYFQFSKGTAYENLSHMGIVIGNFLGTEVVHFDSLSEATDTLRKICVEEKTLVIFDEIPYLARSIPDSMSILQRFIDTCREDTTTMVLICGSSISMMKKETEEYESPLYGRFANRMEIRPLSILECKAFHPGMSDEDMLRTYLTVGGVPSYHRLMDGDTYEKCIRKCFLGQNAPLAGEAFAVVEGELSPSDVHSGILACIADGKRLQNEMTDTLGISKSLCSRYIENLKSVGMVGTLNPMLTAKKTPNIITDGLLDFHYTVLRKHAAIIANDDTARTYRIMKVDIDTLLGRRFELMCRDYVTSNYTVNEIGSWWGSMDGTDTDIDVVAEVYNKDDLIITLLGECKFRREPAGMSIISDLEKKAKFARAKKNVRMAVFSLGGFSEGLVEYASDSGTLLIGKEKLLGEVAPDVL